jgi:capsular polysaccharide biosynthesis protein
VNDEPDRAMVWSNGNGIGDYLPERLWALNDFTADEEPSAAEATGGLVSLKFLTAALRRRTRFLCVLAAVGLVLGCGFYFKSPPKYQASTSLWLAPGPYENINTAANNDVAMSQTRTVAALAVHQLGLQEDPGRFLGTYKVTPITERLVIITASGSSSSQAVAYAKAVAVAFLKFRAEEMQTQQAQVQESFNQQVDQAQQRLNSIKSQISQLPAQPTTPEQQSRLKTLQAQEEQATNTLFDARQGAANNQIANGAATTAAVNGSSVLDPATPGPHSRLKPLILDAAVGLFIGLVLGMAIVVIQALVSDRLRRRDDVAHALGVPVRLSVGTVHAKRWLLIRRGSATRKAEIQRVAAHLRHTVPGSSRGPASLAVVPVDDVQIPASSVVSLAVSCAREGKQVVVADLCSGAPTAKLLGATDSGVRAVRAQDASLIVAVPERDDLAPLGPLRRGLMSTHRSDFTEAVADACASADLLLTLATVDPTLGGEHLATWATEAVAVVTAGRSSWDKIHGVAELIRLSGTRLVSAVLLGADKTDESVGVVSTLETG